MRERDLALTLAASLLPGSARGVLRMILDVEGGRESNGKQENFSSAFGTRFDLCKIRIFSSASLASTLRQCRVRVIIGTI